MFYLLLKSGFFVLFKNSEPILKSISSLPKDELANLFESLINITSLKVKIQDNLETVDVDVDIPSITRGNDFVWTKRNIILKNHQIHNFSIEKIY